MTAAAVLDAVLTYDGPFDVVIMAGYGEHGREGMRQVLDVPVVDITEASAQFACLVSYRFGVATTTTRRSPHRRKPALRWSVVAVRRSGRHARTGPRDPPGP